MGCEETSNHGGEKDGRKAVGMDEVTKEEYSRNMEGNIRNLVQRLKKRLRNSMEKLKMTLRL